MADYKINIPSNSGFYGPPSPKEYSSEKKHNYNNEYEYENKSPSSQAALDALFKDKDKRKFSIKRESDFGAFGFELVPGILAPQDYEQYFNKNNDERLIFEVAEVSDYDRQAKELLDPNIRYYLRTGLYIGYIKLNVGSKKIHLDINCGYNETFLQRMLNVRDDIYVNNTPGGIKKSSDMFANILGFLFLSNFKAAYARGIPTEYRTIHEHGYNVKGKIDIKKYINKDMFIGDGLSYSYKRRDYVQDIIDVLYLAMNTLSSSFNMADFEKYYRELKCMYSGNKVSQKTLNRVKNHRSLDNPMYSSYKGALKYAEMVLKAQDVVEDDNDDTGFSGFLLDVSRLWEVYLEKLLKRRFGNDYDIVSQEELELYSGRFYSRKNRPDLVIKSKDVPIAVLDAKFKTMNYRDYDVDRNDMFQIHSYTGYYNENNSKPIKFCSLVYPSKSDPTTTTDSPLYGIGGAKTIFSVQNVTVGDEYTFDDIVNSENAFLDRIQELLEPD